MHNLSFLLWRAEISGLTRITRQSYRWPQFLHRYRETSGLTFQYDGNHIDGTIALAAMGSIMNSAYLPAFQDALPADVKRALPAKVLDAFSNPQVLLWHCQPNFSLDEFSLPGAYLTCQNEYI